MHRLAARAGVLDFHPFSLRELTARMTELEMRRWDEVAWIAYHSVAPHSSEERDWKDFQPFRARSKETVVTELRAVAKDCVRRGVLPAKLTEAQKQARYQAWERECNSGQRK